MTKLIIPNHLINIIFTYDNTYYNKFKKCLEQIKNKKDLPFWSVSYKYINITANFFENNSFIGHGKYNMKYLKALNQCISLNHQCHNYNRYNHGVGIDINHKPKFIGDEYFW